MTFRRNIMTASAAWSPAAQALARGPAAGARPPPPREWMLTSAGPCPSDMVCLYQNANGGGMMVVVTPGAEIPDFKAIPCPGCLNGVHGNDGTFTKQMSSWDNQSVVPYC